MNARMLIAPILMLGSMTGIDASARADGSGHEPAVASTRIEGHWTLTIRDENGAVAAVHSFENHFVGDRTLADLFLGRVKSSGWAVELLISDPLEETFASCFTPPPSVLTNCVLKGEGFVGLTGVTGLRIGGDASIELSGTLQTAQPGQIRTVTSWLSVCSDPAQEDTCSARAITSRQLFTASTPGIVVEAGQRIDVTLRITAR